MNPQVRSLLFSIVTVVGLLVGGMLVLSATYTVDETEQAVVLRFGEVVDVVQEPGLHFRIPFVHEIKRFEKRALEWDGEPNQIPTKGREFIKVDTTARWKIVDPLVFLKSVRDINGARARLDDVLDSVVRDRISSTRSGRDRPVLDLGRERDRHESPGDRLRRPAHSEDRVGPGAARGRHPARGSQVDAGARHRARRFPPQALELHPVGAA